MRIVKHMTYNTWHYSITLYTNYVIIYGISEFMASRIYYIAFS